MDTAVPSLTKEKARDPFQADSELAVKRVASIPRCRFDNLQHCFSDALGTGQNHILRHIAEHGWHFFSVVAVAVFQPPAPLGLSPFRQPGLEPVNFALIVAGLAHVLDG